VVQGGTTVFHSGADDVAIAAMRAADPAAAPSEWDGHPVPKAPSWRHPK